MSAPRGRFDIEPLRERPEGPPPSYGVPVEGGTFIDWSTVIERLTIAEAYWLGTVTPDGRPHVVPIWGTLFDGELFIETGAAKTMKNRNLRANPNVVVHLDGINDVVIVRGSIELTRPDDGFRRRLADAMYAKYHPGYPEYEPEPELWDDGHVFRVAATSVLAWTTMPTATRWRFDMPAERGTP